MPGFDHFGLLAPHYETFISPRQPLEIWAFAELPATGALLDAGGGTGRVAQFMTDKAHPVVVVDLSYKMLSEARRKDNLHPVCSLSETLPFAEKSFARIIMVDALHHVYDQHKTIDELWRLLQPGGILVIEEPDIRQFRVKLIAVAEKLALMRSHFLAPARIAGLLNYPDACVRVESGDYEVYVIAKKDGG